MSKKASSTLKSIKSGTFSRGLTLAKMTFSAGAQAASSAVTHYFSEEEDKIEGGKALLISQMTLMTSALGELKGSLMKVGQMLSMYGEHILPPEANAVLKSLQSQSPPLEWKAIEKVIKRRLTASQLATIQIEPDALASASLGQVHRATRKEDGELLALKIQYPGVDKAIESDIKAMRRILSMTKFIPGGHQYDELFTEVQEMLHREVDYRKEFKATEEFREFLKSDSRYVVPRPIAELSGPKILTTHFEAGVAVDSPEVAALSQERRNALGVAIYELFLREVFEFRVVQTDAHFGNYKIRIGDPDAGIPDQIILFDFGAMREVPLNYVKGYRHLIQGAVNQDKLLLEKGAYAMGVLKETDSEESKAVFAELCFLVMEPASLTTGQPYDWGKSDITDRAMPLGRKLAFAFKLRPPPREAVFIERKTGGVFIFLNVLKVKFNPRPLLDSYLARELK